jgi:hypothetical protein
MGTKTPDEPVYPTTWCHIPDEQNHNITAIRTVYLIVLCYTYSHISTSTSLFQMWMILLNKIQILQGYLQWLQNYDKQIFSAWFVETFCN